MLSVATGFSNILTIANSQNAETYGFWNAVNYNFRDAGSYNCPKHLPLLFPEMTAIIISRNAGSYTFLKYTYIYIYIYIYTEILAIIVVIKVGAKW